jgi:hypothetical protein
VHPNGFKYFSLRYTLHGKEKVLQPGGYRKMGLADAKLAARLRQPVITGMTFCLSQFFILVIEAD